jgi:hypothetical protein
MRPLFCAGCLLYCHRYQKSWAHVAKNSDVSAPGRAHGVKTSEARGTRLLIKKICSLLIHMLTCYIASCPPLVPT